MYWSLISEKEYMDRFGLSVQMLEELNNSDGYEIISEVLKADPLNTEEGDLFFSLEKDDEYTLERVYDLFDRCSYLYAVYRFPGEDRYYIASPLNQEARKAKRVIKKMEE